MNLAAILLYLVLFAILMAFFSQDKFDYFPIALIIGAIAVVSMLALGIEENEILGFINFNTLIFIFAMQIIIYFAVNDRVLEYIAIKLIHMTPFLCNVCVKLFYLFNLMAYLAQYLF